MRKHNIGRISIILIFLNIIFLLVYLADKNDVSFQNEQVTEGETVVQTEMVIYMDETVDGEYLTILENLISNQKYDKEALSVVRSYEWYLTDNIVNTTSYTITDNKITIYTADDVFCDYVNTVLDELERYTTVKQKL